VVSMTVTMSRHGHDHARVDICPLGNAIATPDREMMT
jgi:hypothetical protein